MIFSLDAEKLFDKIQQDPQPEEQAFKGYFPSL